MLDIEIKHDIDKNYLVVHGNNENTYMLKMLAGNSVKGFLDLEVRVLNNVNQYYYDITGKENFLQKSARGKWTEEELRKMFSDILGCLQKSKEYLLTPEHFVLEPQYLYRSMESGEVFLCYAWNYEKNINEQLTELFAYFMNVVDYEDDKAVDLVYKLYDVSREENCTLQRLWSALSVPKVKRVVIEEEPIGEEIEEEATFKTRKSLGLKKQVKKPTPKSLSQKRQIEKPVPKSLSQKRQVEKPAPKSLSQKNQKEKSPSNFLGSVSKKDLESLHAKSANKKSRISKKKIMKEEKNEVVENSMLLKILLIAALQLAIIGVIFAGAKYGFFFENGGISYTKTGGTLLILGVVDMYLMTKIFGVEELEEESADEARMSEGEISKETKTGKRGKNSSAINQQQQKTSPFILARGEVKGEADEVEYQTNQNIGDKALLRDSTFVQNNTLDKEISIISSVESKDLDGTVVLDYEKTIIDNRELDLLQSKKKKLCYLVPDEKDYSIISLGEFPFFIGRFQKDTGSLKEIKNISRMHSKIEQIGSSFFITDLNSTNGTFVNQKRLEKDKKMELYEGDEIMFANVPYHFTMQEI